MMRLVFGCRQRSCLCVLPFVALLCRPLAAQGLRGGWESPPGFWTACYEADAGQDQCVGGPPCTMRLDGEWERLPGSDEWDGSKLGPGAGAPGGMEIRTIAGEGDGGGDASVLRVIDAGDPRDNGFPDPGSGRKHYSAYDLARAGVSPDANPIVDGGVTLLFRFRQLADSEVDPFDITDPDVNGAGYDPFSNSKAVIGIVSRQVSPINLGFAIRSGKLVLNNEDDFNLDGTIDRVEIPLCSPNEFVSVWVQAVSEVGNQVEVSIYIDGALRPSFEGLVTLSGDADGFGGAADFRANYLYLGLGATGQWGAFDIDYLCFHPSANEPVGPADTIHCPSGIRCLSIFENNQSRVEISWANLDAYDGHDVLRDGAVIATLDGSSDVYVDMNPPSGSHTYELNSKKGALQCRGTCAGLSCTVDVTGVPIRCITDLTCRLDDNGQFHIWSWTNNDAYTSLRMRILLQLGAITEDPGPFLIGEPCVDGGLAAVYDDFIPPESTSVTSALFGENQVAPGSIVVIELTATKLDEICDPVSVECERPSLCPAGLTCTVEDDQIQATWTAGVGLTDLVIGAEGGLLQALDPTASSATIDASGLSGTVTVTLTPEACIGTCGPITCEVELGGGGVGPFKRGDCNQDGQNTGQVTDGVFLLNFLFLGGPRPDCLAACDMNGDGEVPGSPTDAVAFFNFNFQGGAPLPEPLRDCERSTRPGDVSLGCANPRGCPGG